MPRPKAEIGATGLPLYSGRLSLDSNRRLYWPGAGRIYRDMLDNEPAAGALRTAVHTLLHDNMSVTPGGKTKRDAAAANHIEACLQDMRTPLGALIRRAASGYFYGFSILELVYKRRSDGLVGWADWGFRRQETIERWGTKDGRITDFVQRPAPDFVIRTIPLAKCLHVISDDADGSPEGRGALRAMYRHWYMLSQFELLAGIALERFGTGLPVFARTDSGIVLTAAQEDQLLAQGEAIRQNEQAALILPPGLTFSFAPSPGLDAQTYLRFIEHYRIVLLMTGLAEFIALGTGDTGSFALGKVKIDLFLQALTGLQNKLCETINRQAIPKLMAYNGWGHLPSPTVQLPAVRQYDLASLGAFAELLDRIGAFHATPEDEAWFREISDLRDVDLKTLQTLHEQGKRKEAQEGRTGGPEQGDEPGENAAPVRQREAAGEDEAAVMEGEG